MVITLIVLVVSAIFFVNGKIRSDLVALLALISLMVFGILTPTEALSGFSNSIVIMMIGLFVVGGGIFQTGLAKMISGKIMALAGDSQTRLFFLLILVTSGIGAFVSNTGTVALMLPIVVSMATNSKTDPARFLMPLAFAGSMGGMMTLIGTPPNLVINNTLIDGGHEGLSFFSFMPVGIICVAMGTLLLYPLSKWFLGKGDGDKKDAARKGGKSQKELANEYQLSQNLFRVRVAPGSSLVGKTLQELDITRKYNVSILEIRRKPTSPNPFLKTINQKIAGPGTVVEESDVLYLLGAFASIRRFVDENRLTWIDTHQTEESAPTFSGTLMFDKIGIAEVVLLSNSRLVNQPVRNSGFREKYNVNILGIQRHKQYILQNLKDEKMQAGDALLVQGEWNNIARLNEEQTEWVVVGQPSAEASKATLDYKAPLAALIMILMVVCMAVDNIPIAPVTAVMTAAVLMVLTGCFRNVEEAYKTINWQSIVLIGAMLPMSSALEKTGAATMISNGFINGLGGFGPTILLAGIYFGTSLLTLFISNTATAVLFAPIAFHTATEMGISPYPFLFAVTVGASMCFASPFSTPPNALVMSAGRYTFMDYVKTGLPLQIVMGVVMVLVLPLIFPF
ncbi:MAG: SLC13 family permease [Rikenellaceae bacterium]|jgi:di/tricarboxylate transporter|nr:SLC13 family permease [Rikenellaceae bacterium]